MKDRINNERGTASDKDLSDKENHAVAKGTVAGAVTGGVAGGAITGALAGGITGPVGAAIGAAAGAVVGALAGKASEDGTMTDNDQWSDGGGHTTMDDDTARDSATGAVAGGAVGGVAGGAMAGAMAGGMTGPVGAAVGAAVGAGAGALAANARDDQGSHDAYWRDNWSSRPYAQTGTTYDDYGPAYRHGADAYSRYPDRHFDEVESDLGRDWQNVRGESSLGWDHAKHAARDGWERLKNGTERAMPGDADGDGL